jgi:hypothetical protein
MSESRVKAIHHKRIRAGEFQCVYCGGVALSEEPDHMPPRILFSRKQRPNDLIFPSCSACNRGSRALDTIVGWLGRIYPDDPDPREREEVRDLGQAMKRNYPEVASAFHSVDRTLTAAQESMLLGQTTAVNVDDPYVHRCIEFFGAKFGLGMHWRMTGEYVRPEGRVYPQWFTNYMAITGRIPADLFQVFPNPLPLMQGRLNTAGRFEHASVRDGRYTTHLAVFGRSFLVLVFVSPDGPENEFASSGALECEPGCLKIAYPFGLARLPEDELQLRFARS